MQKFILNNLELFIVEGDLESSYNNIKEFSSVYYILEHILQEEFEVVYDSKSANYLANYILENEVLDKLKSGTGVFFSNLKSVFFNAALSKKIGLTSAGLSIGNFFSSYGLSNALLVPAGFTATVTTPATTTAAAGTVGLTTAGIFSIGAFFLLMAGATIYRMVGTNSIVLIKNFEDCIKELVSDLKRYNTKLNDLNSTANKLYENTVNTRCGSITDKKELLICGSKNYMELCSSFIIPEIFRGYYLYLTSKNFNLDYINSAADLFYYKNNKDRISHYAEKMYIKYNEIFDVVLKDFPDFKSVCIKNLNSRCITIFKQELRNAGNTKRS